MVLGYFPLVSQSGELIMEQIPSYSIQADTQMHARLCNGLFLAHFVPAKPHQEAWSLDNLLNVLEQQTQDKFVRWKGLSGRWATAPQESCTFVLPSINP